jgi:cytochrome c oxidase subunit 3
MVVILGFMVVSGGFAGWWLLRQGIAAKPWLEVGIPAAADWGPARRPTARLGLAAFLIVAGSLFALLVSAYVMRMGMADWRPLPMPIVLWFSTGLLALSSLALHTTVVAARRGELDGIRSGLLAAGVSALAFLAGQMLAWRELAEAGYFAASNPAGAFFGLFTAIHGLHLLGGLVALWRVTARAFAIPMGSAPQAVATLRPGVGLCATYWHFLLLVWLLLFALLMRWTDELIEICRGLVT